MNKKYSTIYADPPWRFETYSDKGKGRSAEKHYSCMSIEDICKLPVKNITADDAILFLWAINTKLPDAFRVIEEWGFIYKTVGFYWVKANKKSNTFFMGMGYWSRQNIEPVLLATKGSPKREAKNVEQVTWSRIREHSRKPDEMRDKIVRLCGDKPRIELFARQRVPGWDAWGNELEYSDLDWR